MEKLELFRRYEESINRWYAVQSQVETIKERKEVPDPKLSAESNRRWRTFLELHSEVEEKGLLDDYLSWLEESDK